MKYYKIIILVGLTSFFLSFILDNNIVPSNQDRDYYNNKYNYEYRFEDDRIQTSNVLPKLEWDTTWEGRSYGSSLDYGYGIIVDDFGNTYVGGTSNSFMSGTIDIFLLKYNVSGELEWVFNWGGSGEDQCKAIALDSQNDIYLVGYTNSFTPGDWDACLIKVNSSGIEQWNKKWNYGSSRTDEKAYGICIDSNDNIFVCVSYLSFGDYDICILKYNSAGALQWTRHWGDSSDDEFCYTIKQDLNDNIFIGGKVDYQFADHSAPLLAKFNEDGVFQWERATFGSGHDIDDQVYDIAIDNNNNINIAMAAGTEDIAIIKYIEGSGIQWKKTWDGGNNDKPRAIAVDKNDDIYVSGMTNSEGAGDYDMLLLKYNSSGALQYQELWGGSQYDGSEAIFIDSQGDIYLTGSSKSFGASGTDVFILKYDNLNDFIPNLTISSNLILKGFQNTLFNFSVIYKDLDDNSPSSINVTINGTSYPMKKVNLSDVNFTDGCVYEYLTYLTPAVHNYTYSFECSDGSYYNSTQTYNNLEVTETNNIEPYLSSSLVLPSVGNELTLYNFSVIYNDDDNNLPEYVNITINQTAFSMLPSNPSDNNVMDGTQYYFNTTLDYGYYQFQINCSDGKFVNSTDWILAPESTPFYGYGPVTLLNPDYYCHIITGNLNFTWESLEASFGSVNYTLQISNLTDFSEVLYEKTEIKEIPGITNLSVYISYQSGLYYWRVQPTWGIFKYDWSDYFVFNLTYNENAPFLTLPTVNHKIGDQFTQFNFTVVYFDPDNNYPYLINVTINGTSYSMTKVDSSDDNFTDGCLYQFLTYLSPSPYNYTYFFSCYDGKYSDITISQSNLEIYESNYYIPYLFNPTISPGIGINSTLFSYTVWYYDDDNNLPIMVNLTINDTTYLMAQANPLDINAMDGILYYYNISLDFGYYKFQINCSDFGFSNSTEWIYEPEVNPFYGSSPLTLLNPVNDSSWFTSLFNFNWISLELSNGVEINYTLQISNSTNFNDIIFEKENIKELSGITNLSQYVDFLSGLYYWRVCATYEIFTGEWSDYFMFNLTYNEKSPELVFYSVEPKVGHQYTEFNFTAVYSDSDNNFPYVMNITINGTSYSMSKIHLSDDDYTDGCHYQYLIYLSPSPYNYTYFFNCYDGKYSNFTITPNNLEVKETSFFEPRLLNPLLNPLLGNNSILYNFTIWYFDDDNNLPLYVNITINDTTYAMTQADQFDTNSLDGIEFYYNTTLDFGFYEYQINCSDGFQINTTDWIAGPEVNPFYEYGYITLINPLNYSTYFTSIFNFTWYSLEAPFGTVDYIIQISNSSDFTENGVILEIKNIKERHLISNLTLLMDFPTNKYYWRVRATYQVFHGNWSNISTFNLTLNHYKPYLISGSVAPKIGDQFTEFNFTVEYFDNDNNSPSFINISINGTSYMMNKLNPLDLNFLDGCLYYFIDYLPPSKFNYIYYFYCSDGKYSNITLVYDDLEIIESNYFQPRLTNPSFTPNSGYKYTIFNFTVWYFDDDNNLPFYVNIKIDQGNFSMVQENPLDENAVDGIKFYYNSTLNHRNSQFQIICSDGFNTSSTNWINCPQLNFIEKEAYAIIIGIEFYPGPNNNLLFPVDDALSMYYYLVEECNYKEGNIIFLYDNYATKNNIDNAFAQIQSQIGPYDTFFFYFAGHGGTDGRFEFICPYDSLPSSPSNLYYWDDLSSKTNSLGCAEKYIIIDACNSGGMIHGTLTNKFFMTACDDNEECLEVFELKHGLFTYYFLISLDFAGDINKDGVLSMEEQFPYIYSKTVSSSTNYGYPHHPQNYDGIAGESVLSPSLASPRFTPLKNELNFSFYLYGNGRLDKIELTIYSGSVERRLDLYYATSSITGFGYYSGLINLEENLAITGYKLIAEIRGDKKIILEISQGGPSYDSATENGRSGDSGDYSLLMISVAIIASVVGGLAIIVYLKNKASNKAFLMKSLENKPEALRAAEMPSPAGRDFRPKIIMICPVCNTVMNSSEAYCPQCGRKI